MENSSFDRSAYPILNLSAWPERLVQMFKIFHDKEGSHPDRIYVPVNRLLCWAFGLGSTFDYMVDRETINFVPHFMVYKFETLQPVLLVEIKDYSHVNIPSQRLDADLQMRKRYDDLMHDCPLPRLFGLSMLGTSTRIYQGNVQTRTITPDFVERPPGPSKESTPDEFLAGEWALDLMSAEGFLKMREIVDYIVTHSAEN